MRLKKQLKINDCSINNVGIMKSVTWWNSRISNYISQQFITYLPNIIEKNFLVTCVIFDLINFVCACVIISIFYIVCHTKDSEIYHH